MKRTRNLTTPSGESVLKISWKLALLAGLVGTLVFDLLGLALTGSWWDIPKLLSSKLGVGLAIGAVAHYAIGFVLAVIYSVVAPSLWGPRWVRALTFVTVETILGVWRFMMPLLGLGIAGLGVGVLLPVISLARHWGFGLALASVIPVAEPASAARPAELRPSGRVASQI